MNRRSETTTKVFVGSLPTGVSTDDLRTLFAPYGAIAECDISNRCGFLHLEDSELALKAVEELNGTNFMGGRISVEKGRVKPRRGPGGGSGGPGPMRGGKDRGGPYARNDFRGGPPHRNGGGFGGREFPPYGSPGGGDRFGGYDRPQRGGYDGGYGDRRPPPYDDRRGGAAGGFGAERRPFGDDGYGRPYEDDRAGGYAEAPRAEYDDRRSAGLPPRGPSGYERGAPPVSGELYSRRDQGPKSMYDAPASSDYRGGAGGYSDRTGYTTVPSNGYGSGGGYGTTAGSTGGYGSPAPAPSSGYGTSSAGFGSSASSAGGYGDARGYGTATGGSGGGYGNPGGYGDSYGATGGGRGGSYDAAYPPLPQQRGGFTSGGGPGPRRDMAAGRRF